MVRIGARGRMCLAYSGFTVFERFTERARKVVGFAEEEARTLKHDYIGTEHLLLGLLREQEGLGARVLESLDVRVEPVRTQVLRIAGSGEEVTSGRIPFTPRAKKVLELALYEALSLGHHYIGTEHLLLGLLREGEGVATRVLLDLGADSEKVRNEVIRVLSGPGARRPGPRVAVSGLLADADRVDRLLEGASGLVSTAAWEIEEGLGRPVDAGDLLVLLASIPDGLVVTALTTLDIDADKLTSAVDQARREDPRSSLTTRAKLASEIERVRQQKEAKIQTEEFQAAAQLRDRERELTNQAHAMKQQEAENILTQLRRRLGLPEN